MLVDTRILLRLRGVDAGKGDETILGGKVAQRLHRVFIAGELDLGCGGDVRDMVAYDLVWDAGLAFASASAHDQVATVVGIPVGTEDGVGQGCLRERDVRAGFVHHGKVMYSNKV
ncbi:hypothetical protein KC328_g60 [Hortaea werneckii]|nr:hypothetical protein KC328_g60 [Hortaea werneckii]